MQQDKQGIRRVGLGRAWEDSQSESRSDSQVVRVRTGKLVTTGRLIGEQQQPRAFVWIDEAANDPKRDFVICPDFHGTWLWENGKESSLEIAFPERKEIQRLVRRFDHWLKFFETHWNPKLPQRFFWARFHEEGLALARQLQGLAIDQAVVRYWRPAQDPRSSSEREILL